MFGYANQVWSWQDCWSTIGCMTTNIANFWDQYLRWFLENLQSFVYFDAINQQVINWSFGVFMLFMFLSFVVGFIFITKK